MAEGGPEGSWRRCHQGWDLGEGMGKHTSEGGKSGCQGFEAGMTRECWGNRKHVSVGGTWLCLPRGAWRST